jgi:hypothetical protein
VFAVGAKDMKESPRFRNIDGVTKKGTPTYYKSYRPGAEMEGHDKHGYMMVAPHVEIDVPGYGEMCGTSLRQCLGDASPEEFETIMGFFDQEVYDILQGKLEEMSSCAGGSVVGSPGSGMRRTPGKSVQTRGPKDFIGEEDEIVSEVVDYLLGISVG